MPRRVEIPPFDRAYEGILEHISVNGLVTGDRLPSERDLCCELDVSRTTLRSALAKLAAEHVVEIRPGAGSFVCPPRPTFHLDDLSGFSEVVRKSGAESWSRVVEAAIIPCPDVVALKLGLAPGELAFKLVRLRGVRVKDACMQDAGANSAGAECAVRDEAVCIESAYIAAACCPGIEEFDFSCTSFTGVLEERFGQVSAHMRISVSVERATAWEAGLLDIAEGALVFFERGLISDEVFAPVEYYESIYVPERFGIVCSTVFRQPGAGRALREEGASHGEGL